MNIFKKTEQQLKEFEDEVNQKKNEYWKKFLELKKQKIDVDEELLKDFLEEYWYLKQRSENEWEVIVPRFLDFSVGWLDHTTKGYNIFIINKYTQWLGELPEFLRKEIQIKEPRKISFDGENLIFEEGIEGEIQSEFGEKLSSITRGSARVKKGKEFDLIASIVESGSLPFIPCPVDKNDLRDPQVKFDFKGKYAFQEDVYKQFLKYGAIGVYWMTGAGKSFLAMYVLDSLEGKKALVIPTLTLIEQWKEYFEEYAPRLLKEVELLTYQGYEKIKNKEYKIIVFDECLVKGTKIIKNDGSIINIEEVENNDSLIGGNVENKFKKTVPYTIKITHQINNLETTNTHKNIVLPRDKLIFNKHKRQYEPAIEKDILIKFSEDLNVGDYLLTPLKFPHLGKSILTKKQLRFISTIMCDGHILSKGYTTRINVTKDKEWFRKVFKDGLKDFGIESSYREKTDKRGNLVLWSNNRKLFNKLVNELKIPRGKKGDIIKIPKEVLGCDLESLKGFIDGAFCCEGDISQNLNINSTSEEFIDELQIILLKYGVISYKYTIFRYNNHNNIYRLSISSSNLIRFRKIIKLSLRRKQNQLDNLKLRNFIRIVDYNGNKYFLSEIKKIEKIDKEKDVYDFTCEPTHTFIANNTLTHNCHVLPADTFSRLATLKTKYRLGLSATPYREDKRTNYIFALTGYPVGLEWHSLMKILGKHYHDVNVYIVNNVQQKINLVSNLLNREKKTIIFINELDIGHKLADSLGLPFIHGATKNRMVIARENKVFIASRVMELGISLKDLEHIIEIDFLFGSKREQLQRTGRLFHSEEAKTHDIIFTKEEFEKYGKRLHSLIEKGFRINLKPMISGTFTIKKEKILPKGKEKKDYSSIVEELYDEGFFVTERKLNDICDELQKRGVTAISQRKAVVFNRLNSLVKRKKLYKVKKSGGYEFIQR